MDGETEKIARVELVEFISTWVRGKGAYSWPLVKVYDRIAQLCRLVTIPRFLT